MPAVGEIRIVHRCENGMHADQFSVANQGMCERQCESAFQASGCDRRVDSDHMIIGEVGSTVLGRHWCAGKLRPNGLRGNQIEQGVCFGRGLTKGGLIDPRDAQGVRTSLPEFDHEFIGNEHLFAVVEPRWNVEAGGVGASSIGEGRCDR